MLALLGFVGLSLLVVAADASLAARGVASWYLTLNRPSGMPPTWIFGPLSVALYGAIGIAAWLVWQRIGAGGTLRLWGWQLLLNALWTPAFFGLRDIMAGLVVMVALLGMVAITTAVFARISRPAGWLMAPYLCSVAYAAYLNAGFCWLN